MTQGEKEEGEEGGTERRDQEVGVMKHTFETRFFSWRSGTSEQYRTIQ
jgi:hypothetical protein